MTGIKYETLFSLLILSVIFIVSCSPSEDAIQKAIEQTALAATATFTPSPTNTPVPTGTAVPTPRPSLNQVVITTEELNGILGSKFYSNMIVIVNDQDILYQGNNAFAGNIIGKDTYPISIFLMTGSNQNCSKQVTLIDSSDIVFMEITEDIYLPNDIYLAKSKDNKQIESGFSSGDSCTKINIALEGKATPEIVKAFMLLIVQKQVAKLELAGYS